MFATAGITAKDPDLRSLFESNDSSQANSYNSKKIILFCLCWINSCIQRQVHIINTIIVPVYLKYTYCFYSVFRTEWEWKVYVRKIMWQRFSLKIFLLKLCSTRIVCKETTNGCCTQINFILWRCLVLCIFSWSFLKAWLAVTALCIEMVFHDSVTVPTCLTLISIALQKVSSGSQVPGGRRGVKGIVEQMTVIAYVVPFMWLRNYLEKCAQYSDVLTGVPIQIQVGDESSYGHLFSWAF